MSLLSHDRFWDAVIRFPSTKKMLDLAMKKCDVCGKTVSEAGYQQHRFRAHGLRKGEAAPAPPLSGTPDSNLAIAAAVREYGEALAAYSERMLAFADDLESAASILARLESIAKQL